MTETMELLHCNSCDHDKPLDQMRKDSRSPTGYRQQCKACKQAHDKKRPSKNKPRVAALSEVTPPPPALVQPIPVKKSKPEKLPPEERLYVCLRCNRDDVSFDEMTKDRRKYMGVGSWCLSCRRERDAEKRSEAQTERRRQAVAEEERLKAKRGHYADEWEYCYKCNTQARPGVLKQPPAYVAAAFPEDAGLCANCITKVDDRETKVMAERNRLGVPENATRKQLESAARVAALRELAQVHEPEFRKMYNRYLDALGIEVQKKWITL